VTSNTRPTRT